MAMDTSELSVSQEREAQLIEEVCREAAAPVAQPKAAPVLLVGLGGTGAEVLRRVKARISQLGTIHACRFLVVDMDDDVRNAQGPLPGFEANEFCFVNRGRGRVVFRQPNSHPGLVERFDLKDPDVKQELETIFAGEGAGAGQVRPLGLISFYANYAKFETLLDRVVTDLSHRWADLTQLLRADQKGGATVNQTFYVVVVASLCGGTGSSTLIDVAAALNKKLGDRSSQITAILTLPDVYAEKVKGKIDEDRRIKANAYATLREIDCFQTGLARRDGVRLQGVDGDGEVAPAKLFDRTYLVSRTDAADRDLGSMNAVFETIALHVTAEVAHTIGGKLQTGLANDAALKGLARCRRSGKPRIYGTLGASALTLPVLPLLRYCVFTQMRDYVGEKMLGVLTQSDVDRDVDAFLAMASLEERAARGGDNVLDRIRNAAYTGPDGYVNKLYQHRHEKETLHFKDRAFIQKYDEMRKRWGDMDLLTIKQALREQRKPLVQEYSKAVAEHVGELLASRGIRYAKSFVVRLHAALRTAFNELKQEAADCAKEAIKWDAEAKKTLRPLQSFFGQFGRDEKQQSKVVSCFRSTITASVEAEARDVTASVLASLTKEAEAHLDVLGKLAEGAQSLHGRYETESAARLPAIRTMPRRDEAEVDVTTREFLQTFYQKNRMPVEDVLKALTAEELKNVMGAYRGVCSANQDSPIRQKLLRHIARHFAAAARNLSINEVLHWEAKAGGQREQHAEVRLEEAVKACRPLWRADIGVMGEKFSDTVVIGLPESSSEDVRSRVAAKVDHLQAAINADERYQATIQQVSTHDPLRIYAIRQSHGGLPFYLSTWEDLRRQYQSWARRGAHPIHIFPRALLNRLPPLEPSEDVTDAERAFALGLAFGWIAVRGKFYYLNLLRINEAESREAVIHSHWDCVTFQNKQPRPDPGAIQKLIDNGLFRFSGRAKPEPKLRLGGQAGGRAAALRDLSEAGGAVREILGFFEELRKYAGDDEVARDLNAYTTDLLQRYEPHDDLYERVKSDHDLLEKECKRLQRRIGGSL